jgi:putative ABC transport system permease protein
VAGRFWPGQDPIGKRIRYYVPAALRAGVEWPEGFFDWRNVVGVVNDTHIRSFREPAPMVYLPWRQSSWAAAFGVFLAVQSSRDLGATTAAMRRVLEGIDPTLTVWDARPMDRLVADQRTDARLSASLVGTFAAVALVLAAVGLYGAMASAVREQTREIGIRAALGAAPGQLRRSVVVAALRVAGLGTLLGLGGAALGSRLVSTLLYGVKPNDPTTLVGVSVLLVVTALAAAYLPARRATQIDPVQALRAE